MADGPHSFWSTQPVPQSAVIDQEGPINTCVPENEPPVSLPEDLHWMEGWSVNSKSDLQSLYLLLRDHYVEDSDSVFRFDYQPEFLHWSLTAPHWDGTLHVAVADRSGQLVAFISAVPGTLRLGDRPPIAVAEVNFLCLHRSLRSKKLAPALIQEVTRRVHLLGMGYAIYTAGKRLPEPFSKATFFHRPLRVDRILQSGFCGSDWDAQVLESMQRDFSLCNLTPLSSARLREAVPSDLPVMHRLFAGYQKRFQVAPIFSEPEFEHWLLPQQQVPQSRPVWTFVFEDRESGVVVGFFSFYSIPSTVLNGEASHLVPRLQVAYAFYYAIADHLQLSQCYASVLLEAAKLGFDLFNATDVMENRKMFDDCQFGPGDGELFFYLYNWKLKYLPPDQIGVVLL